MGLDSEKDQSSEESVRKKLNDYLLNPEHPVGKSKAKWFQSALGFTRDNENKLAETNCFQSLYRS